MAIRSDFQSIILNLQRYWAEKGVILQPYDMEVGAGTFHPATTLRALGPGFSLERCLCATVKASNRWPLWRKSQSSATLLSVPDHHETIAA